MGFKDWRATFLRYAPVFVWIGVIFVLSSNQGSMSNTSILFRPVLKFLFPMASEETIQIYHGYIRKTAHFTEYAVLALFALRALARSSSVKLQKLRYFLPILLVASIASLDEFNQSFNPARTSSLWDVALDISGGLIMTTCLWLIGRPQVKTPCLSGSSR